MKFWFGSLLLAVVLGACASTINPVDQASSGYDAITFRRAVQVRDHALNIYTFSAGAKFIADRRTAYGPTFCGLASLNDDPQAYTVCVGVKGASTLVIGPGSFLKQVDRDVPPGTFERTRQVL